MSFNIRIVPLDAKELTGHVSISGVCIKTRGAVRMGNSSGSSTVASTLAGVPVIQYDISWTRSIYFKTNEAKTKVILILDGTEFTIN